MAHIERDGLAGLHAVQRLALLAQPGDPRRAGDNRAVGLFAAGFLRRATTPGNLIIGFFAFQASLQALIWPYGSPAPIFVTRYSQKRSCTPYVKAALIGASFT